MVPNGGASGGIFREAQKEVRVSNGSTDQDQTRRGLLNLRQKLLDLTARNKLLNYQHPKGCIRLVDELPNQVAQEILSGKSLFFIPVPNPTPEELKSHGNIITDPETNEVTYTKPPAEEWAKHLKIQTNYELPKGESTSAKHQDNKLQTLLYPHSLEARLRPIRTKSESAIKETGSNVLFLILGFLEWTEAEHSDRTRLAPLFTIPVKLEKDRLDRGEGVYRYKITFKDEDVLDNITLHEKLENDFGLALPPIGDMGTPDVYFTKVRKAIIKNQPDWKIHRYITLGTLDFRKQSMYHDLDPDRWPSTSAIENHPLVQQFFCSGLEEDPESDEAGFHEEHSIDEILEIHKDYPLIFDADSSQHSALIDALNGENLVIQGPPGTGKSQTITNLIAASIANGKSVLFVAEKMAALNVVKRRLDQAGLGDFCLELHSHLTNKNRVLRNLEERMEKRQCESPNTIDQAIHVLLEHQAELSDYATRVNEKWRATGMTRHKILNGAVRFRMKLDLKKSDELSIDWINGEDYTPYSEIKLTENAKQLKHIYELIAEQTDDGMLESHHWYGITKASFLSSETDDLLATLRAWTDALQVAVKVLGNVDECLDIDANQPWCRKTLKDLVHSLRNLPDLTGGELLSAVKELAEGQECAVEALNSLNLIHNRHIGFLTFVNEDALESTEAASLLRNFARKMRDLGFNDNDEMTDIYRAEEDASETLKTVKAVAEGFEQIRDRCPSAISPCLTVSRGGLKEFCTLVEIIESLPSDLWRHRSEVFANPDIDPLLEDLKVQLADLINLHEQLKSKFDLTRIPASDEMQNWQATLSSGGLLRWLSSSWRRRRQNVLDLVVDPSGPKRTVLPLLPTLIQYAQGIEKLEKTNKENPALRDQYAGVETPIDRIDKLRSWYKRVQAEYGIGWDARATLGKEVLSMDRELANAISTFQTGELLSNVQIAIEALDKLRAVVTEFSPLHQDESGLLDAEDSLVSLQEFLKSNLMTVDSLVHEKSVNLLQLLELGEEISTSIDTKNTWLESPGCALWAKTGFPFSVSPNQLAKQLHRDALATIQICEAGSHFQPILDSISATPTKIHYDAIRALSDSVENSLKQHELKEKDFCETGKVDPQQWAETAGKGIQELIDRNNRALAKPDWLNNWLEFLTIKEELIPEGLSKIISQLEKRNLKASELEDVVKCVAYNQLSTEILKHDPILRKFKGLNQNAVRKRFQEYDVKMLKLQRQRIAAIASGNPVPRGISTGLVGKFTEASLIKHEIGKKKRHIALRDLTNRSGRALAALKPCFMMSPMSVARFLEPGKHEFDLIIMDEASQIRPEDALGAIARGRNLVIVGDPKQLPPTSFFDTLIDGDDAQGEIVAAMESESILEVASPMFTNRRLRWHYRSRHESLIEFSNHAFYNSDLVLFPSPFQKSSEYGVKLHRVAEGCFIEKRNFIEVTKIIDFLVGALQNNPQESFGVVAMNIKQRDDLEIEFENRVKSDGQLREFMKKTEDVQEPLFFKNLENVQGDERDVIIISMTYGPMTAGGAVPQRFGPINQATGWRRLNVLFTRAKKRMHIFTSMSASDILIDNDANQGKVALHNFLRFCEGDFTAPGVVTGREADSDFEVAVRQLLSTHGFECDAQVGVAGYFLDLAVRDPKIPGHFVMGIECDGATYHSARSARDRDRLRQDVLEGLGWKIRRIWSTDWFKNPEAQIQPILNELKKLTS